MESISPLGDIVDLAGAWQSGAATDDERARLERLLEDSDEARLAYLQIADQTVTINDIGEQMGIAPRSCSLASCGDRGSPSPWKRRLAVAGAMVAACLAVALTVGSLDRSGTAVDANKAPPESFARIVNLSDVRWANGARRYREWQQLGADQSLQFDAGSVEVLYQNGIQLVIQGPAEVTFLSQNRVAAASGKLVARVGPDAIGFEIVTPHAKVIDLGTSFGVSIDPALQTDVVVYEGKVDLALADSPGAGHRRLAAGEAIRVGRGGRLGRIASVAGDAFLLPPRPAVLGVDDGGLIVAVTDNLKSSQTAKYYRVIPHGFREDCRAYVDRRHQWNGLDERGIPPFLKNGDYVMTFNDDKVQPDLRIAVTLAKPAHLYLLVDDRIAPPDWLSESFVDTGWNIGIDEGYDDLEDVKTAVGAGQSVEWTFSVWRQDVSRPSTVQLGSLLEERTTSAPREVLRAMYGIVAVPLGESALQIR